MSQAKNKTDINSGMFDGLYFPLTVHIPRDVIDKDMYKGYKRNHKVRIHKTVIQK